MRTLQSRSRPAAALARRVGERPLGAAGAAIIAAEISFAAIGTEFPVLSAAALLLAPGLLLLPLLPAAARQDRLVALAAAPALAFAASSTLLITASAVGIPLEPVPLRILLAVAAVGLLVAPLRAENVGRGSPTTLRTAAGLAAVLALAIFLQERMIGGSPVPGNDWAKYLLYADEIREHGRLLIDNPFWFLGMPFFEDPGVPSLYGGFLVLGGQSTAVLSHGVWAFAVAGVLAAFAFARAYWGNLAGVLAAGFWGALPMSQDILGWHGLANVAALALLPVVLLYLVALLSPRAARLDVVGLGLLMVGLAAAHRLSFAVGVGTTGLVVAFALLRPDRWAILRRFAYAALAALVVGAGVIYDLLERSAEFGGYQSKDAYLSQKVAFEPVVRDLTLVFSLAAVAALVLGVAWARRDRRLVVPLAAFGAVAALAYAWVLDLPLFYIRMAYFLPIALCALVAVALVRLLKPRLAAIAGAVLILVMAGFAVSQSEDVRGFYSFATPGSLRGLDVLEQRLEPGDVVVTDRCWSFLATWLLRTDTLAALEAADIQPKAEVERAAKARQILAGTPRGRRLARELGVRYLVVNPTCTDTDVRPIPPPVIGRAVYLQRDLVIVELPQLRRSAAL